MLLVSVLWCFSDTHTWNILCGANPHPSYHNHVLFKQHENYISVMPVFIFLETQTSILKSPDNGNRKKTSLWFWKHLRFIRSMSFLCEVDPIPWSTKHCLILWLWEFFLYRNVHVFVYVCGCAGFEWWCVGTGLWGILCLLSSFEVCQALSDLGIIVALHSLHSSM